MMTSRFGLMTVICVLFALSAQSELRALSSGCCKCIACPGVPNATGTESASGGGKSCTGENCAHGSCANITNCGEGPVSSRLLDGASVQRLHEFDTSEWIRFIPRSLLSASLISISTPRMALVVKDRCDAIVGVRPMAEASIVRLAWVLPQAERLGPQVEAVSGARDRAEPRVIRVAKR